MSQDNKMNSRRSWIAATILVFSAVGGIEAVHAQESLLNNEECQLSAKEILSKINTVHGLSHSPHVVLVAGEVRYSQVITTEKPLSLTQALAMVGGVTQFACWSVYIVERVSESELNIKLKSGLREVYTGSLADPKIENGNIVFVPKRFNSPRRMLQLTDSPIKTKTRPRNKG